MQIKIWNASSLPLVDYRGVKVLQGNLKDLSRENHDKLLKVLKHRGFTAPLLLWRDPKDGVLYLLDGTQRHRIMLANDLNDGGSYCVPYVLIPGENIQEAKEQLLELTSQYGKLTMEGLDEFAYDLDLETLNIHFDALDLDKFMQDDPLLNDETDGEVEQPKTPSDVPKVKRYTSEMLRQLAKDYHPRIEETLLEFIDWLDRHDS